MTKTSPRQAVEAQVAARALPSGDDERFAGYGVMGMPYETGHYLALRDMVASSVGPAYRALWHRTPSGDWTIHSTVAPELSCGRYFASATAVSLVPKIEVQWHDDYTLSVAIGDELSWRIELASTPATRMMTAMGRAMPAGAWNRDSILGSIGPMAGAMLQSGRVRLRGHTPNGPGFKVAPLQIWRVVGGSAEYRGEAFGRPAPLKRQAHLGDFWLPQRGVFVVGRSRFTPAEGGPLGGDLLAEEAS